MLLFGCTRNKGLRRKEILAFARHERHSESGFASLRGLANVGKYDIFPTLLCRQVKALNDSSCFFHAVSESAVCFDRRKRQPQRSVVQALQQRSFSISKPMCRNRRLIAYDKQRYFLEQTNSQWIWSPMKSLRQIITLCLFALLGQGMLASDAHAIWRTIAVTHSTATLMQILRWGGPEVRHWKLKPVWVLKPQWKGNAISLLGSPSGEAAKPVRLSAAMRRKIVLVVGAIESRLAYGIINNRPAGGGIAYGILQVLSRHGGLHRLIKLYSAMGGRHGKALLSFGVSTSERVARNRSFQWLLREAGKDRVMRRAQTIFFSREYLRPSLAFGRHLGLVEPASYLILFDTFIHYGNKPWLKRMLTKWFRRDGEHKAILKFLYWMRRNLHRSYTRSYGRGSLQVRYNAWRASYLQYIWLYQPKLKGPITVKPPQWRNPVIIR